MRLATEFVVQKGGGLTAHTPSWLLPTIIRDTQYGDVDESCRQSPCPWLTRVPVGAGGPPNASGPLVTSE